jgi:hypothetical protein
MLRFSSHIEDAFTLDAGDDRPVRIVCKSDGGYVFQDSDESFETLADLIESKGFQITHSKSFWKEVEKGEVVDRHAISRPAYDATGQDSQFGIYSPGGGMYNPSGRSRTIRGGESHEVRRRLDRIRNLLKDIHSKV